MTDEKKQNFAHSIFNAPKDAIDNLTNDLRSFVQSATLNPKLSNEKDINLATDLLDILNSRPTGHTKKQLQYEFLKTLLSSTLSGNSNPYTKLISKHLKKIDDWQQHTNDQVIFISKLLHQKSSIDGFKSFLVHIATLMKSQKPSPSYTTETFLEKISDAVQIIAGYVINREFPGEQIFSGFAKQVQFLQHLFDTTKIQHLAQESDFNRSVLPILQNALLGGLEARFSNELSLLILLDKLSPAALKQITDHDAYKYFFPSLGSPKTRFMPKIKIFEGLQICIQKIMPNNKLEKTPLPSTMPSATFSNNHSSSITHKGVKPSKGANSSIGH